MGCTCGMRWDGMRWGHAMVVLGWVGGIRRVGDEGVLDVCTYIHR